MREVIAAAANARFPEEACGFVLKDGTVVECENVSEEPLRTFRLDPEQAIEWWNTGQVAGVWHSHPSSSVMPSEEDERLAHAELDCYIYSVMGEDLALYRPDEQGRLVLVRLHSPE